MNTFDKDAFIKKASLESVRKMDRSEAYDFCNEIRQFLVDSVLKSGGHLASNLGIVEISLAIARSFDMPDDKIIYDTGHQAYVHKIITGRADRFDSLRSFGGISGFPKRSESEYDYFGTGHSGTGLSAALGYAKACKLNGKKNWSVVVVGDGSFPGGEVFEALNNIQRDDRVLIILNDNKMSISKSVGAFGRALNRLRTAEYYRTKDKVQAFLQKLPLIGDPLELFLKRVKKAIKRIVLPYNNLFEQFGLTYFGPSDGNDLSTVEFLINEVKRKGRPAIIHLCTKKGKGYPPAEKNPTDFHGVSPASNKKNPDEIPKKSFSKAFGDKLCELAEKDKDIVAITAAMTDGVGLTDFAKKFPDRLFDTGIAEEHAMTFAASLSASGKKPVFAVYSTFFQRSYDQLIHDVSLQNIPVLICLDRAGLSGEDGATHHGLCDIAMGMIAPNVRIYAPASTEEAEFCLENCINDFTFPAIIRYPKGSDSEIIKSEFELKGKIEKKVFQGNKKCVIITFGRSSEAAVLACKELEKRGDGAILIRFPCLKGYPENEFDEAFADLDADKIIFIEEGMKKGSFSENLLCKLDEKGILKNADKKIIAIDEKFITHGNIKALFELCGFTAENIVREIDLLGKN